MNAGILSSIGDWISNIWNFGSYLLDVNNLSKGLQKHNGTVKTKLNSGYKVLNVVLHKFETFVEDVKNNVTRETKDLKPIPPTTKKPKKVKKPYKVKKPNKGKTPNNVKKPMKGKKPHKVTKPKKEKKPSKKSTTPRNPFTVIIGLNMGNRGKF
ncbi:uncharacterized protein LOC123295838 [Chrysoperla carnea]|uniref:uncharacterized protein LOC123295838 n=1 Tax=Chrysoperla carnea TaxID=189513 RepID=UPI001D0776DD|nr:uncharacterized protein LOC123295838 [Chrysoperla carnea]